MPKVMMQAVMANVKVMNAVALVCDKFDITLTTEELNEVNKLVTRIVVTLLKSRLKEEPQA